MIKKILLLTVLLLLTASCLQQPFGEREADGTEGVEINFMQNHPPSRIYENNPLEVVLELRNMGVFDEPEGKITLHGYDSSVISFQGEYDEQNYIETDLPSISARTQSFSGGGYETLGFEAVESGVQVDRGGKHPTNLIASVCYLYRTTSSPSICIVPPHARAEDTSCTPKRVTMESQGAPIAITEVTPEVISDRLEITAVVENKGDGEVIAPKESSYEKCPFNLEEKDFDVVQVNMSIGRLPPPECDDNMVNLRNGRGIIRCVFETDGVDTSGYTTQVNIKADYLYKEQATRNIEILSLDR
ncbi:MAG: hypothetical protein ACOCZQ_00115 [Nanoarchaeota archaeon]